MATAETALTQFVDATNNVRYAYRRFGRSGTVPVVLNIHFRGNMDHWDPWLVNELANEREVILFDNAGVGKSTGEVPSTFSGWARGIIEFVRSLNMNKVDILGFSMGGIAVIEAALAAPELVRKLIIAGSKATVPFKGSTAGIVWPQESSDSKYVSAIVNAVTVEEGRDALKYSCFPVTARAIEAADAYWKRLEQRSAEPVQLSLLPMDKGGMAQVQSVMETDVAKEGNNYDRLEELKIPVLIMNGDDDVLIPSSRSWELLRRVGNAQLIIYPRSGHGFLWQYAKRVGRDINNFLDGSDFED